MSAPGSIGYNNTFGDRDRGDIAQVTLIGLSSVTHRFNAGQCFNHLSIVDLGEAENAVRVQMPANTNVCSPGHYLLFIFTPDDNGLVPSVARIGRIA